MVLEEAAGHPLRGKVEGIALHPRDPMGAHVVVDHDVPGEPAELCEVALDGHWIGGPDAGHGGQESTAGADGATLTHGHAQS